MSKSKVRQFYCYKFNTKHLAKEKYDIKTNFNTAKKCGEIVSISDNQILRTIRDVKKIKYEKKMVDELYRERDWIKK